MAVYMEKSGFGKGVDCCAGIETCQEAHEGKMRVRKAGKGKDGARGI